MRFFVKHRGVGEAVLAGSLALVATGAVAQQKTVSDAQVEANVLRQLATAPELSTQNIQSTTVYGTVTLSGTVQTEALRTKAENLAARADGAKKVVDELTLGDPSMAASNDGNTPTPSDQQGQNQSVPQNQAQNQYDGYYPQGNYPQQGQQPQQGQSSAGAYAPQGGAPAQQQPYNGQQNQPYGNQPPAYGPNQQQAYSPNQPPPGYGNGAPAYNQPYGQTAPPPQRQPLYSNAYPAQGAPYSGPGAGQLGGVVVTVAPGALLQVRVNRGIDSNHIHPGTPFDGVVLNDVVSGGQVAIPRGTSVQGTVIDAKKAGTFKGEGELSLALTSLTLGGQTYPIASVPWDRQGRDKTISTVNSALGMGALGAIFGGVAGGGAGAAIGAAAGGAVGVAGAASSPGGRVIVPPESVLTFHLAQPATVTTVSQQEMARLSYAAGPAPAQGPRRRYYSPYGAYYGPTPPPGAYYRPY